MTADYVILPHFVTTPDDKYKCVFCKNVLRPPVKQTVCGHRLCGSCARELFREEERQMCPANEDCSVLSSHDINPDIATTKELLRMAVNCPYKENGCSVTLSWNTLNNHEATCEYATLQCQNQGCTLSVPRSRLAIHEQHECEYLATLCSVCYEYVPRLQLTNAHKNSCSPKPLKCPYNKIGCLFEAMSNEMKQHNEECLENHSKQLLLRTVESLESIEQLKEQFREAVSQIKDLRVRVDSIPPTSCDAKTIQGLQISVAKLAENVAHIHETLTEKVDHNALMKCMSNIANLQGTIRAHESKITALENARESTNDEQMKEAVQQMESSFSDVNFRLTEYDVRFRLLETAGYDGHMIWKVADYQRRKKDAIDGRILSLYSQPFYTSTYGYKMCARVYLNGDGMGRDTHMSLFFVVMRGDYDALLSWPFRQRVTLALLDQSGSRRHIKDTFRPDPTSSSFKRPVSHMNVASGSPMFATQSTVESTSFLTDDTIFIRVSVDTSDLQEI